MSSLHTTLKHIAAILSYKINANELRTILSHENINWDDIVKIGSSHLMLPAIYSQLHQKNLLDILPKDLEDYLKEICAINKNRNKTLLEESKCISKLFESHNITHVFVKGVALLAGGYYNDPCERMIGDIDVLIHEKDTQNAYNLLLKHNYSVLNSITQHKTLHHRHLDRLLPKEGLGAVEIHMRVLKTSYKTYLQTQDILGDRKLVNGIYIPSPIYLVHQNILGYQINDYGRFYNNISLKVAYDSAVILKRHPKLNTKPIIHDKLFRSYLLLNSNFFTELPKLNLSAIENLKIKYLTLKLKNLYFYRLDYHLCNILVYSHNLMHHARLILKDKNHYKFLYRRFKLIFKKNK